MAKKHQYDVEIYHRGIAMEEWFKSWSVEYPDFAGDPLVEGGYWPRYWAVWFWYWGQGDLDPLDWVVE